MSTRTRRFRPVTYGDLVNFNLDPSSRAWTDGRRLVVLSRRWVFVIDLRSGAFTSRTEHPSQRAARRAAQEAL